MNLRTSVDITVTIATFCKFMMHQFRCPIIPYDIEKECCQLNFDTCLLNPKDFYFTLIEITIRTCLKVDCYHKLFCVFIKK